MSESNVPMTVRKLSNITKLPARYMSWSISELSRMGPAVGRLRTIETITEPETRVGSIQPIVLTIGLIATRTGYLSSRRHSDMPLARAVTT